MDEGWLWIGPLEDDGEELPLFLRDQLEAARIQAHERNETINEADRDAGIFRACDADEPGSFLNRLFDLVSRRIRAEPRVTCQHVGELRPRNLAVGRILLEGCDRPECVESLEMARTIWRVDSGWCALCGDTDGELVEISTAVVDGRLISTVCKYHIDE